MWFQLPAAHVGSCWASCPYCCAQRPGTALQELPYCRCCHAGAGGSAVLLDSVGPKFVEGYFQPEGGLSKTPHMQTVGSSSPATTSSPFMVFQQLQGTARQQLVGALSPAAPWGCSLAMMQEWGSLSLNIPHWNGGVPVPFTSRSCINQVRK